MLSILGQADFKFAVSLLALSEWQQVFPLQVVNRLDAQLIVNDFLLSPTF